MMQDLLELCRKAVSADKPQWETRPCRGTEEAYYNVNGVADYGDLKEAIARAVAEESYAVAEWE